MTLIDKIRTIIPDGSISQDMITGFQGNRRRPSRHFEVNGICEIQLWIYVFLPEDGTLAGRKMEDDIRRKSTKITEIVTYNKTRLVARTIYGQIVEVLVKKFQKNLLKNFSGRNSQSITVVFQRKL
jgi:tRNA-2-methylthio-N6-dimethylallyladenosine synthase